MALFRPDFNDLPGAELTGKAVILRHPRLDNYDDWARLRALSRDFLIPWEPQWTHDELTRSAFKRRLRRYAEDRQNGRGFAFFVYRNSDDRLVGGCNISNVRRGVAQSASLGYWIGKPFARQGLTSAAVDAACRFAFDELRLHRVEAACIPDNTPSRQLLKRVGFCEEGLARKYLKIHGEWRDHVTLARLQSDTEAL